MVLKIQIFFFQNCSQSLLNSPLLIIDKSYYYKYFESGIIFLFADKPLLMLQSIKRAYRLDSTNPELHSCLVRFALKLVTLKKETEFVADSPVLTVIEREMEPILRDRSASQINKEFLAANSNDLPSLFEGETISSDYLTKTF